MKTLLTNMFEKICRLGINNRAEFLKITGVTGLILGCLAQTSAIIFNQKIDKKEKSFLIPQELADGALNSALFWVFTSKTSELAKRLVLSKKIIPESFENVLKDYKPQRSDIKTMEKHFFDFLQKTGDNNAAKTALTTLNGIGLAGMIIGSILSVNIITPIIRNKIASKFQQNKIKTDIQKNTQNLYNRLKNIDYSNFNKTFVYTKNNVCSYNSNIKI